MEAVLQSGKAELEGYAVDGITASRVAAVKAMLQEVLGEEWVSDAAAILSSYHRDFTGVTSRRPNLVALPASTAEVQHIIRIANQYEMPVVVLTTGFNHGGMCLPRRGGIVVDLKRMDKVLEVDEESMSVTVEPYVRIAVVYEEANKRFAADNVRLRIANPLTLGGVSLLSNYVSGGMSHTLFKTGHHHENIISMTWVLPDGSILKTGAGAYPNVGNVGVLGPGPDMSGMFLNASGSWGICTEITIKLFVEPPYEKMFFLHLEDERTYDMDPVIELFYKLGRENFIQDVYKGGNRHQALLTTPMPEAILESLPVHFMYLHLTGLEPEEIEIKKRRVDEIVQGCPNIVWMHPAATELFYEGFGMTEEELNRVMMKRFYLGGRVMRWKGAFYFIGFMVKLEKALELERLHRRLVDRFWKPTDPNIPQDHIPWGCSLQGPSPMGRNVALEFDYYSDPGNPDDARRLATMLEKVTRIFTDKGAPCIRMVGTTNEIVLPRLGTYFEIVKKVKDIMDPANIMNPDVLPLGRDYIG